MGYWGWRPLLCTLVIGVWITGCSLTSHTAPTLSPTQPPRITLTLRVREPSTTVPSPSPHLTATPEPGTPAPASVYVVRPGDTLLGIALDLGLLVEQLRAANPNIDPLALQVGQQIVIPQAGTAAADVHVTPIPLRVDPPACYDLITGSLLCLGSVTNLLDQAVARTQVRIQLLDGEGMILAETTTGVEQTVILPGQSAPYGVLFSRVPPEQITVRAESVRAVMAVSASVIALDVESEQVAVNGSRYRVAARIMNHTGIATQPPRLVLTVYDAEGRVAGFRVLTMAGGLEPGGQRIVEIEASTQPGSGGLTHQLYAEAYVSGD